MKGEVISDRLLETNEVNCMLILKRVIIYYALAKTGIEPIVMLLY